MSENTVQITLRQQKDYQFDVDFGGGIPVLVADEPAPLGSGQGPSPVQLLAAAVGNCLSDSLLFVTPAPSAAALLGLAGLATTRRRR